MLDQNLGQSLQTIALVPMSDITAGADGTGVDLQDFVGEAAFFVSAKNVAGTNPTLDVKLQDSADNSSFADVTGLAFTQVTAANTKAAVFHRLNVNVDGLRRYVRAVTAIGGTSSPQFLVACYGLGVKKER
jgi:hypothetical protein